MRKVRFKYKRNHGAWGLAFPEQWRIEIDPELDDLTLLEIAAHEVTHVVLPVLDEEAVDALGKQIASVLHRMGFRRED